MRKLLFFAAFAVFAMTTSFAQSEDGGGAPTSKGTVLIEANTGNAMLGNTGIYFSSSDGNSVYNVGLDGGYFIMDDLALKAGLGFGGTSIEGEDAENSISYRIGGKYYIKSMIPITLDLTGAVSDVDDGVSPLWLGVGAGYALFIGDNVSIEPGLRYNHSLNEDYSDKGIFQFNVGFALYF